VKEKSISIALAGGRLNPGSSSSFLHPEKIKTPAAKKLINNNKIFLFMIMGLVNDQ
jgi:hypothetical protein